MRDSGAIDNLAIASGSRSQLLKQLVPQRKLMSSEDSPKFNQSTKNPDSLVSTIIPK
ncbi:hypothetical protein [Anabaena sp. UHCC 0451]|uniref:hypothetical protein n=1 Tax=Anabaena sp. UHCC 0451 TaxID=2055235 RepID=UPI002B21252E|nr:hypothetical protein [Anabaena sp. UHCC 0451]MEA5578651.1 hypothetical protein [Anabaena sp. UHCC 0451]